MADKTLQSPQGLATVGMYTETLARLYVRQGFVQEALHIYRRLAQERPQEGHLHEQIKALEQQLANGPPVPDRASPAGACAAVAGGTPGPATRHRQRVIEELQRWLRHLQRQRAEQQLVGHKAG
jgi:hypothetical protein